MPDIPIDTLFIVGLLIASFVGKFIQKKPEKTPASEKPTPLNPDTGNKNPSLTEVLKEAWERANQPEVPLPEVNAPSVSLEENEPVVDYNKPITNEKDSSRPTSYQKVERVRTETPVTNGLIGHSWIKNDLLSNRNSLKRAVVLKEILDKPKSLRSFYE